MTKWVLKFCDDCGGMGLDAFDCERLCDNCDGWGWFPIKQESIFGILIPGWLGLSFGTKRAALEYIHLGFISE
jgi:hypothetical protein